MPESQLEKTNRGSRTDLIVTTAQEPSPELRRRAKAVANDLGASVAYRRHEGMHKVFAKYPDAQRAVIVQTERLVLQDREGHQFFYHPNMGFIRLGNLLRGFRDLLIDAAQLQPGDSVLDATLGYASEAILCAHVVGETGEVHGIESVQELGYIIREGLQTVVTEQERLNRAMRRIQVVHLGHHWDYLRSCPTARYDVVCFDPFFDEELPGSEQFAPIRYFGDHEPLRQEAVQEAQRVARRCVLIKSTRWSHALEQYGVTEKVVSRNGKVAYGVLPGTSPLTSPPNPLP
jgi:hypothetical protein